MAVGSILPNHQSYPGQGAPTLLTTLVSICNYVMYVTITCSWPLENELTLLSATAHLCNHPKGELCICSVVLGPFHVDLE